MKCTFCHEKAQHFIASIEIPGHERRNICRPCAAVIASAIGFFCLKSSEALGEAEQNAKTGVTLNYCWVNPCVKEVEPGTNFCREHNLERTKKGF